MTGTGVPPQAYTRETLAKAFDWLKNQPTSIRELANTADNLVGLYLQSQRRSGKSFSNSDSLAKTNPVSSQEFKSDLKNLALGLQQFEEDDSEEEIIPPKKPQAPPLPNRHPSPLPFAEPHYATTENMTSNQQVNIHIPPMQSSTNFRVNTSAPHPPPSLQLDSRTKEVLKDVQSRLNLSSEGEALRMLVTLGYDRIRQILPES